MKLSMLGGRFMPSMVLLESFISTPMNMNCTKQDLVCLIYQPWDNVTNIHELLPPR